MTSRRSPTRTKSPKRSPTRAKSPKRSPKRSPRKDCEREWVRSPVTNRWIEVGGKTWDSLYSTHRDQLEAAPRQPTPGVMDKRTGVCTPPKGDPPRGRGGERHEGGRGEWREGRGWRRGGIEIVEPYYGGYGYGCPIWDPYCIPYRPGLSLVL